jgi:hypothetical protein
MNFGDVQIQAEGDQEDKETRKFKFRQYFIQYFYYLITKLMKCPLYCGHSKGNMIFS